MGSSRYPRRGHRIAPLGLRESLDVSVPTGRVDGSQIGNLRLCDLDESVWERFDEAACEALAGAVIRAVGKAVRMPAFAADQRLPPIPDGMKLADLELEIRRLKAQQAALQKRGQGLREQLKAFRRRLQEMLEERK